jgi:hypothetical protein
MTDEATARPDRPHYFAFFALVALIAGGLFWISNADKHTPPSAAFKEGYNIGYTSGKTGLADASDANVQCEAAVSSATAMVHSAQDRQDWIGGCEAGVKDGAP